MQVMWVRPLGREDPLEEEMATHSSILAWKIPCAEDLGGLQSMGSQESNMTEQLNNNNKSKSRTDVNKSSRYKAGVWRPSCLQHVSCKHSAQPHSASQLLSVCSSPAKPKQGSPAEENCKCLQTVSKLGESPRFSCEWWCPDINKHCSQRRFCQHLSALDGLLKRESVPQPCWAPKTTWGGTRCTWLSLSADFSPWNKKLPQSMRPALKYVCVFRQPWGQNRHSFLIHTSESGSGHSGSLYFIFFPLHLLHFFSHTYLMDMNLSKLWEIVKDKEPVVLQSTGPLRVGHMTEQLNNNNKINTCIF